MRDEPLWAFAALCGVYFLAFCYGLFRLGLGIDEHDDEDTPIGLRCSPQKLFKDAWRAMLAAEPRELEEIPRYEEKADGQT